MKHFLAIITMLLLAPFAGFAASELSKPNILLIVADDLNWRDLGFTGNRDIHTPSLDKLRSEGMWLRNMFNPATTCSPTRHALYTGLDCIRSGAYPIRSARDARYKYVRNLMPENTYDISGIHHGQPLDSWKEDAKSDPTLAKRIDWLYHRPDEELYDLQNDPLETNNLAKNAELAPVKARLSEQMDAWMAQQGDKGIATEMNAKSRQGKGRESGSDEAEPTGGPKSVEEGSATPPVKRKLKRANQ